MKTTKRRSGFTLPEVLVTVTIVAVLASVVVPSVVNQVHKGDQPATQQDLDATRTGITEFATDVRQFPASFTELSGTALPGASLDIVGNRFNKDTAGYHGPYLSTTTKYHVAPLGAIFQDSLHVSGNQICLRDSIAPGVSSLVSRSQAYRIDSAFDNANGTAAGSVTWTDSTPTTLDQIKKGSLLVCLITYK